MRDKSDEWLSWNGQLHFGLAGSQPNLTAGRLTHQPGDAPDARSGPGHEAGIRQTSVDPWIPDHVRAGQHGIRIHTVRGSAWGVDLNPVVKDEEPHGATDRVIPMSDGVDNRLAKRLFRQLRPGLGLEATDLMWNGQVKVEEALSLIDHLEQPSGQVLAI